MRYGFLIKFYCSAIICYAIAFIYRVYRNEQMTKHLMPWSSLCCNFESKFYSAKCTRYLILKILNIATLIQLNSISPFEIKSSIKCNAYTYARYSFCQIKLINLLAANTIVPIHIKDEHFIYYIEWLVCDCQFPTYFKFGTWLSIVYVHTVHTCSKFWIELHHQSVICSPFECTDLHPLYGSFLWRVGFTLALSVFRNKSDTMHTTRLLYCIIT